MIKSDKLISSETLFALCDDMQNGIISPDILKIATNDMYKRKVLEVHHYKISPPTETCQYWQTHFVDERGNRKRVKSVSEERLFAKLYRLYFDKTQYTLEHVFDKREEKRRLIGLSPRTILRERQRFNKYVQNTKIAKCQINQITDTMIETAIYQTIKQYKLNPKELSSLLGIYYGCFRFAVKEKIATTNIMNTVDININVCSPSNVYTKEQRVYLLPEQQKILKESQKEFESNNIVTPLAVQLEFKLGLRIGELVALKFSDVSDHTIHIQRMETKDDNDKPIVVNYLKKKSTQSNRQLPIGQYELDIIEQIKQFNERNNYHDNDYMFLNQRGRIHSKAVDYCIRKLCSNIGIEPKSCHDIRRTVASTLHMNHVPIEIIKNYMGHSDEKTTWGYIYDTQTQQESNDMIQKALLQLNAR